MRLTKMQGEIGPLSYPTPVLPDQFSTESQGWMTTHRSSDAHHGPPDIYGVSRPDFLLAEMYTEAKLHYRGGCHKGG